MLGVLSNSGRRASRESVPSLPRGTRPPRNPGFHVRSSSVTGCTPTTSTFLRPTGQANPFLARATPAAKGTGRRSPARSPGAVAISGALMHWPQPKRERFSRTRATQSHDGVTPTVGSLVYTIRYLSGTESPCVAVRLSATNSLNRASQAGEHGRNLANDVSSGTTTIACRRRDDAVPPSATSSILTPCTDWWGQAGPRPSHLGGLRPATLEVATSSDMQGDRIPTPMSVNDDQAAPRARSHVPTRYAGPKPHGLRLDISVCRTR